MIKLNSFYFYIFIFLFSCLYSQMIQHKVIENSDENQDLVIDVLINADYSEIENVTLYYKSPNQFNYLEKNMIHKKDNFFNVTIPGVHITNANLEYYITLELKNNKIYSFPYKNPKNDPIIITVNSIKNKSKNIKSNIASQDIQILSPLPNSRVFKDDLFISLSYFKLKNIDKDLTKVFLNNRDITSKITFYDNYFIYKPDFILDGQYNIDVIFTDNYNRQLEPFKWSFFVISKDKLSGLSTLFNQSGRVNNSFSINDINSERLEVNNLNLDYRVNFDFLKIRNKVKISSLSSEYEQDKNRYVSSIKAPYIDLQLGDSYPYFNQYVLNGYRVRGLNLKIDSKFFDFHVIQGELARSVEGNPIEDAIVISNINTVIDSVEVIDGYDINYTYDTTYVMDFSRDNYTFKRNIYGFNIGIGMPKNIFLNFNVIKAEDNINTISNIRNNMPEHLINLEEDYHYLIDSNNESYFIIDTIVTDDDSSLDTTINYSINYNTLLDSLQLILGQNYSSNLLSEDWVGNTPKDNLVIGSNIKLVLDKDEKMVFNFGASLSLLNQNTWEPILSIESLDTLFDDNEDGMIMDEITLPSDIDFSDYEDIFKFSFNQVPLLPIDISSGKFGLEEIMTMPSLAYNIDFSFKYFNHNINFGIKQIGPEYYSLANPYLQQDIREQFFNDKFRTLDNRLFVNYGFKRIEDGIEVDKNSLSKTDKYDLGFNYYPGYDLPNYSLSFRLLDRDNGIDSLDVFTYEQYVGIGEPGADELGYMEVSDTTNRRENTNSFQANFNISYNYNYYGSHNLLLSLSQLNKKDLLFNQNIEYDSLYFSPRSFNQTMVFNIKSKWSKIWSSNISLNYNNYNYGNDDYFQEQFLKQLDFRAYYYRYKKIHMIQVGANLSIANGFLKYYQISSSFNIRLEPIKNLFFDLNYQYRFRDMTSDLQRNQYFFIKTSYNF